MTDAVAALYPAEHEGMLRLARLLTGSDSVAEEVVQDAFLRVQEHLPTVANPGGYLRATVVNICRDYSRRRRVERRVRLEPARPALPPEIDETWSALASLPRDQRAVVVLRFYLDMSEAEIARIQGCRPGTVKSRLNRALGRLREELR